MKKLTGTVIFLISLIYVRCGMSRGDTEKMMVGIYVRSAPDKNGILFDTVKIATVNPEAHQFVVERRLHYRRKGGQQTLKDYSRETYAAYYNTGKNVLEVPEVMGFLTFGSEEMLFGNIKYQKIK